MPVWPPTSIAEIPDAAASDPTWPTRDEISPLDLVGPTAANKQEIVNDTRTETIRELTNQISSMLSLIRDFFLDRDGDNPDTTTEEGPTWMLGDLDLGTHRIVNLADAVNVTDMVTVQQLEAVQFAAEDQVQQILADRVILLDGTIAMQANLDMGTANRVISVGAPLPAPTGNSHVEIKSNVDATDVATRAALVRLDGSTPLAGSGINMQPDPLEPGFKVINVADATLDGDLVNKRVLDTEVATVGGEDVPVGTVLPFCGAQASIPTNFLPCDGREVSRLTYSNLFSVIGVGYGTPSSGSLFKLPDLRGRVIIGRDVGVDPLGDTSGTETVALTLTQLPSHTHSYDDILFAVGAAGSETGGDGATDANNQYTSTSRATTSIGSGQAHSNMQPSMAMNYMIRF